MENQNKTTGEGQRISYQIANRTYSLKVHSAEEEAMIRRAVKYISTSMEPYKTHYQGRDEQDYLAILLLQSTMKLLELESHNDYKTLQGEIESLDSLLGGYLQNLSR